MRISLLALLSLASLLLVGCVSPAQRLEPNYIARVQEASSRSDVEKIMGKPDYIVTGSTDNTVAHYGYTRRIDTAQFILFGNLASNPGDILLRHLSVLYDRDNVVEQTLFHQSLTPFETGFGNASAGAIVQPESLRQIKKGVSTEASLVKLFGEPQLKALNPEGNIVLEWYYARSEMGWIRNKNDVQVLSVALDRSGRVQEHGLAGSVGR